MFVWKVDQNDSYFQAIFYSELGISNIIFSSNTKQDYIIKSMNVKENNKKVLLSKFSKCPKVNTVLSLYFADMLDKLYSKLKR